MASNNKAGITKLEAVAAGAASLADDVRDGKIWADDLHTRLSYLERELREASRILTQNGNSGGR